MSFITYELDDDRDESGPYVRWYYTVWYEVSGGVAHPSLIHFDRAVVWIEKWGGRTDYG